MTKAFSGSAIAALWQQVEIFGGDTISLDSLWRAAGQPAGKEPRAWAELAVPLVEGFDAYLARLKGGALGERSALWRWNASDGDPWRNGDLMAGYPLAQVYAVYLDQGASSSVA